MTNIQTTILVIHTLIALGIIALVLLQRGKGADAGAAFGAGASGTVFGARGSTNFFSRTTAILATGFFVTSLTLAYISSQRSDTIESLLESAPAVEASEVAPESTPVEDTTAEFPALEETTQPELVDDQGMPALDAEEATGAEEPAAEPVPEE
jgi:preprotein translocase subunit SecG